MFGWFSRRSKMSINKKIATILRGAAFATSLGLAGVIATSSSAYAQNPPIETSPAKSLVDSGKIKYDVHDLRAALVDFRQAREIDPRNWMAHYNEGVTFSELGMYADSIRPFEIAAELTKYHDVSVLLNLSKSYSKLERYDKSFYYANEAIKLNPSDRKLLATAYGNRGTSLIFLGKIDLAMSDMRRALSENPDMPYIKKIVDEIEKMQKGKPK